MVLLQAHEIRNAIRDIAKDKGITLPDHHIRLLAEQCQLCRNKNEMLRLILGSLKAWPKP